MPYYTGLARVARAAGLDVTEVAGWRTRGHGPMGAAQSVMWHHTAGAATGDLPSLGVLRDGRAGLPGPLCHYGLGRTGQVYVIAAGLAYHAGRVSHTRYSNAHSIGIEAENTGLGQPWPKVQLDAYHALTAALCEEFGWDPDIAVIGHKEAARPVGRKIDPRGIDMNAARARVRALMNTPDPSDPLEEIMSWYSSKAEFEKAMFDNVMRYTNPKVTGGDKQVYTLLRHAADDERIVRAVGRLIDASEEKILAALETLHEGEPEDDPDPQ